MVRPIPSPVRLAGGRLSCVLNRDAKTDVSNCSVPVGRTAPLAAHLKEQGVEFIQFAFRWMNCLLMRELSVKNIVRMWDTYLVS